MNAARTDTSPLHAAPEGNRWLVGARLRTLPAAVVPVAVGTAVASTDGVVRWERAALALVVSLALQVGVNFANDYSDGVRGTDDNRVGPRRLVASGLAQPREVKTAALIAFAVAAVAGAALAVMTTMWLVAVGLAAIASAWTYTGGPRPYGYAGFGELFVFIFFGLVAVVGSAFVHREKVPPLAWGVAVPVGMLAVSLLVVNNLRDVAGDRAAGKRTLAVRVGVAATRHFYVSLLVLPLVVVVGVAVTTSRWPTMLALASGLVAAGPIRAVTDGASGASLIAVLGATGRYQLIFGALLSAGLVVSR